MHQSTDSSEHQDKDLQDTGMSSEGNKEAEHEHGNQPSKITGNKYFIPKTGKTLKCHEDIIRHLLHQAPGLDEVQTVEDCDVILFFCTVASQAGTDIEAALADLNACSESKPAILMVLHHTFDPERDVLDSSKYVNRRNTLTVDCLFHEDEGLVKCKEYEETLARVHQRLPQEPSLIRKIVNYVLQWITDQKSEEETDSQTELQLHIGNKYFILQTGKKLRCQEDIIQHLLQQAPGLMVVQTVEDCDVILVLCTIASRAGTDIEAALAELNACSESKPAILMVLHHTFDPERVVLDSSKYVNRMNTLTVDCLFHEDEGLLKCKKNEEALAKVQERLPQEPSLFWNIYLYISQWITGDEKTNTCETVKGKEEKGRQTTELQKDNALTLVLLGTSGKSAAGYTILGKEERRHGATPLPTQLIFERGTVAGRQVVVVDTPDWVSSGLPLEKVRKYINLHMHTFFPESCAFLLVIPVNQYTEEKTDMIQKWGNILEETPQERLMILFTVSTDQEKKNIKDFIKRSKEIQKLVEKCGSKFHCLNVRQSADCSQVVDLLEKIEDYIEWAFLPSTDLEK